ncbi:MAG TPA: tetratricopeptide repeat protein [Anaeromyxobacteraceae bacterium]|jgi:hypothetical protein|nr:tetratricopeptide repeat protein [Anaeromyxobacteraceae bacterium]
MPGTLTPADLASLERAFAGAPDSPAAVRLAEAYLAEGRVVEALVVARRRVRLHPEDAAAHALLARVHLARGHQPDAQRELAEAARLAPWGDTEPAAPFPAGFTPATPAPSPLRGEGQGGAAGQPSWPPSPATSRAAGGESSVAAEVSAPERDGSRARERSPDPAADSPRARDLSSDSGRDPTPGPSRRQLLGTLTLALIAAVLLALTFAQALNNAHRARERDAALQEALRGGNPPAPTSPSR